MGSGCCSSSSSAFSPVVATVSGLAPAFSADAYANGGFTRCSLQQFLDEGKWVVLFFYPLDFTFVCPTEIQEFARRAEEFSAEGAQLLGVSVDSVHAHQAWSKGDLGEVGFPLLSDMRKDISAAYGVLHEDGMSLRGTFLIDPEGIVRAATVHDLPLGRSVDETLRVLRAAKTGELCPVGWRKGEQTLGKG